MIPYQLSEQLGEAQRDPTLPPPKCWSTANVIYYYQDKLGTTTHIADAGGALLESYRYDLYGAPSYYDAAGNLRTPQASGYAVKDLYAGERWISDLRLYDLRNRFMLPELGRFLQPDPIGFKGDASNLYRYCGNGPVDRVDPLGLEYQTHFEDATHVRIEVPIIWKGGANSDQNQKAFTKGIEDRWKGTEGGITYRTVVTDGRNVAPHLANTVYIKDGNRLSGVRAGREGEWYVGDPRGKENVGAHEVGHFLGLRDRYKRDSNGDGVLDKQGRPIPEQGEDPCNIMVTVEGKPGSRDIHQILSGDGKGYRGWAPGGETPSRRIFDAYGSTTEAAANWEKSYGYGGWIAGQRNRGR